MNAQRIKVLSFSMLVLEKISSIAVFFVRVPVLEFT